MTDQPTNLLSQWQQQPAAGTASPSGVSLPVKMQTPGGSLRVYMNFGSEFASPEALNALIEQLNAAGVPLDLWQPKQSWSRGRGGNGGGFNRGSW